MVISCFTAYDWSRCYLLPDTVTANIPLRGSIGEPGAYNAARGLLVEVCRCTGATPQSLQYIEEQRPGELLTTITAHAALRAGPITVTTQYQTPLRTRHPEQWLISVNDVLLTHEQHRYPPSPPYQGSIVARWLQP